MSMLVRMAAMALTWSDLERSKLRTRIFQRAVTWKRLQIGPWLPLKLNRKSLMLFQRAPVAVTWSDLAKPCPWSKAIGNGIYCAPWHSASSYYYRRSSSKGFLVKVFLLDNGDISLIFQDISMKLGGHIGHGPNSSYHHF